jgi:predicted Zn finger-like uncharacterized protein
MNIQCKNCHSQFNIPDHKIPKDRDAVFNCPKCKEKIIIPAQKSKTGIPAGSGSGIRPETAVQNQPRALILALEGPFLQPAVTAVQQLGYTVETASNPADAIKKMAYHVYPLVLLEDRFDPEGDIVSVHMNTLDMSVRRSICLVLMSSSFPTGDPMTALHASVNGVIGPDHLSQMPGVLSQTIQAHADFYRVYMDSMKAAGKA